RFAQHLKIKRVFEKYMKVLTDNFNERAAENIMCRNLLSVRWDGTLYDCDFNQAEGLAFYDKDSKLMRIGNLTPDSLNGQDIIFESHCYSCTAGAGSSCSGALTKKREEDEIRL
ncbi:MAG: DUF3641 domain-containing protein, partial [Omnitrophica bacterium]|nr:DUF3641 domain-containing protein [Candidatus Omnitrophota bacterium]